MGYISKVQVIQRGQKNRQYYFICPAPLAQALEIQKGEELNRDRYIYQKQIFTNAHNLKFFDTAFFLSN